MSGAHPALEPVGGHRIKIIPSAPREITWRCECGETPHPVGVTFETRGMAEDSAVAHLTKMRRVRGLLHNRNESLDAAYAHYLAMSQDPEVPTSDREQWAALAQQVGRRLGMDAPPSKQEELFEIP